MRALAPLLALATVLTGCLTPAPEPARCDPATADDCGWAPATDGSEGWMPEDLEFTDLEGTLLALPAVGGQAEFTYEVPAGATWVGATLAWQTRGTKLLLTATDPAGREKGDWRSLAWSNAGPRAPTRLDWWVAQPNIEDAGTWTFTVRNDELQPALQEPVALQLHTLGRPLGMHVAQRTEVVPGAFVEVNMEMLTGQVVSFNWTAASPVYFNIHTHRNGETINLVEETTPSMASTFTAEEDGGYSLLWALEGGATPLPSGEPVPLTYRVDGAFELHSAVG